MTRWIFIAFVGVAIFAEPSRGQTPPVKGKVQYARDVQPILSTYCFTCHGPDEKLRKGGLRLDLGETATRKLRSGMRAVVPGSVKDSELFARIHTADETERMPPAKFGKSLKDSEKALLKQWIDEGAEYQRHWAFVAPKRHNLPKVNNPAWVRNPIDAFVLGKLESQGMKPSPEADRYTLARRLSLDLTGLPPTLEMVDRFVGDKRPDAYEKYVEELLNKSSYGEHWAHVWLDLARYADSNGYATDNLRTIWRYRDWVVDSINRNQPFDQFTVEQIAGDMIPSATQEQILATAFHRNTLTNDEGGTVDEEFRVAAVVDRVNTTMQVWMGMTMACAQCHDHKYDALSQEEYFRMFAIFNQSEDADRGDNTPLLTMISPAEQQRKSKLETELAAVEKSLLRPSAEIDAAQAKWEPEGAKQKAPGNIKAILQLDLKQRNDAQKAELSKHYRTMVAVELKTEQGKLNELKKQLTTIDIVTTPIMKELGEKQRRKTQIQIRGNYLDLGKEVTPGLPALFPPPPKDQPLNRLTLARWLVAPENPLTARVAVNRYWELVFGIGLMESPDDFGIRGKLPNHPEMLDWLSAEFVAQKWDVKKLLTMLVTSATYRQASTITPAMHERDAENRWFARGPRFRSSAETIRDQALFISGLLSPKMHGPPVRPLRPKSGLTAAFGGGTDWDTSAGDDKYRRALYTQWRRTSPYPSLTTFDAPSRNVCTISRPRTNTPLQALVTLNDPVYVEAAQALGRRMVKDGGTTVESRIQHGVRLCVSRPARDVEVQKLAALFNKAKDEYTKNPKLAQQMATDPLGPLPSGMQAPEMAAWTVVGNVLLNLDELFAKR